MFAIEIDFRDGISPPETVLLRRTTAILGGTERSHLIIDGAGSQVPEIQLYKGVGRTFFTAPLNKSNQIQKYTNDASIVFGNYKLHITSLDTDLCLSKDDLPDLAAARVLKTAINKNLDDFPAICLMGENLVCTSFYSKSDIVVGRSPYCSMRIDLPDISSEHCRFGFESNSFWVEDLGSTNGTIVENEKISGRCFLKSGQKVQLGTNTFIIPIDKSKDLIDYKSNFKTAKKANLSYPCLVSNSDLVRPNIKTLKQGVSITVGRDPTCDIWINASHISREHLRITLENDGNIKVADFSSNGTYHLGRKLKTNSENSFTGPKSVKLDLCSGVYLDILFSEQEEQNDLDFNKESGGNKSRKDKLNEENSLPDAASDHDKEVEDTRLSEFEKYQLEQSSKVNLEEVFEDEEEFKILAAKLEQERVLEARVGEYRIIFFILLLVLLIASICVLVFTSDYLF